PAGTRERMPFGQEVRTGKSGFLPSIAGDPIKPASRRPQSRTGIRTAGVALRGPPCRPVARAEALYAAPAAPIVAGSTLTPGPMVEEMATRSTNVPLAPAGRDFCTASVTALMLAISAGASNPALPMHACIIPAFSA